MFDPTRDCPDDQHPRPLLAAALVAAERGWPVFRLRPYSKIPAFKHWPTQATTNPALLTEWWRHLPYNVGIACGPAGLVVLDLDASHGHAPPPRWARHGVRHGRDVLALLAADRERPDPVDTYTVATPTGGEHRYFSAPAGIVLRNSTGDRGRGLGWHVDVRAGRGAIVAAGSVRRVHGCLTAYRVIRDDPVAPLPDWLTTLLAPSTLSPSGHELASRDRSSDRRVDAWLRAVASVVALAEPGTRHATLNAVAYSAGRLVGAGELDENEARAVLRSAAPVVADGRDRFTRREAERTIDDGLHAGRRHPRSLAEPAA